MIIIIILQSMPFCNIKVQFKNQKLLHKNIINHCLGGIPKLLTYRTHFNRSPLNSSPRYHLPLFFYANLNCPPASSPRRSARQFGSRFATHNSFRFAPATQEALTARQVLLNN
nr:MAG TPA: hypothetical protein [Caudoviricetes sp.]